MHIEEIIEHIGEPRVKSFILQNSKHKEIFSKVIKNQKINDLDIKIKTCFALNGFDLKDYILILRSYKGTI